MIKVIAQNFFHQDKMADAKRLAEELAHHTLLEGGCTSYSLFQDLEDPNSLVFIEEWESAEALESHFKSEHFTRIFPALAKWTTKESVISQLKKIF